MNNPNQPSNFNLAVALAVLAMCMFFIVLLILLLRIGQANRLYVNEQIFEGALHACEQFNGLKHVLPNSEVAECNNDFVVNISPIFKKERDIRIAEMARKQAENLSAYKAHMELEYKQRCESVKSELNEVSWDIAEPFAKCKNGYFVHNILSTRQLEINRVLIDGEIPATKP